jgi:hypothetical protein
MSARRGDACVSCGGDRADAPREECKYPPNHARAMSEPYTPTTEDVLIQYAGSRFANGYGEHNRANREAAFYRWLAQHDREVLAGRPISVEITSTLDAPTFVRIEHEGRPIVQGYLHLIPPRDLTDRTGLPD